MSGSERRTAIVATLGPVSETRSCVEGLVAAGMDVVRMSMSNASRERHVAAARLVREVAAEQGRRVRLMADLQGRKNRLGKVLLGRVSWSPGDSIVLTSAPGPVTLHRTWTTQGWDADSVAKGGLVLIDDGAVVLEVVAVEAAELRCVVVEGGVVTDGRGVTMPGATNCPTGLNERDRDDLRFAVELGVDMVALSFAGSAEDSSAIRSLAPDPVVIGKVENAVALARLPSLAASFDGLMVARGDLGLEIPFEEVPLAQRRVLAECAAHGRTSMVATQLLHSMRTSQRPTRAEVSDVANAVLDGAGALVLTGETGYGQHPVRVVEVLRRIIERTERYARPGTVDADVDRTTVTAGSR